MRPDAPHGLHAPLTSPYSPDSYIGLEFSDVYTALGSSVTFIEALDRIMPGFDLEIAKLAQRVLIQPRNIDYHTGVLAAKARSGRHAPLESKGPSFS